MLRRQLSKYPVKPSAGAPPSLYTGPLTASGPLLAATVMLGREG
jgi:hypothetical protein